MTTTVAAPSAHLSPVVQYALHGGPLLSMLDSSVVNVAVAPIARQLRASLPLVQWTVSGYLLALGTGLAATAYPSRRLGTLRLYQASVTAFTVTSAACALAPSVQLLLVARVIQGLAAAPLVPLAMSMLFCFYPLSETSSAAVSDQTASSQTVRNQTAGSRTERDPAAIGSLIR